jgi:hypothetical protein
MSTPEAQQEIATIDEKHATKEKTSDSQDVSPTETEEGRPGFVSRSRQNLSDLFTIVSRNRLQIGRNYAH